VRRGPDAEAALGGDEAAFGETFRRHRRELHVHCYRMLGSFTDAEDVVQETFLRAWRARDSLRDGGVRAWLYRIATNACLDALRVNGRRLARMASYAEVPWLQPYPDALLDQVATPDDEPDAMVVARETIELAYLAAIQLLPARQRAALVLRDVLGWTAAECAQALDITVAAVNSATQRARATLRDRLPPHRSEWSVAAPTGRERAVLARFIDAHERGDVAASVAMMREDIRVTMPPHPWCFDGVDAVSSLLADAFGAGSLGRWKLVPTAANRMPAAASYLLAHGETTWRAFKLDVLRVVAGRVVEVTTFDASLFPAFGLPAALDREQPSRAGMMSGCETSSSPMT
jgi:RNA polymerase sigma-70 factor (TIGR02960 family)